jgi:hypothetical protein
MHVSKSKVRSERGCRSFRKGHVRALTSGARCFCPVVRVGVARAVDGERNHAMVRQSLARD